MHLHAHRYAEIRGRPRALAQRQTDLYQGPLLGNAGSRLQPVGAHLDAGAAEVGGEPGVLDGAVDIPSHLRRISGVILERAAEAGDLHARIGELPAYVRPLGRVQFHLDAMRMRGAQLHAREAGSGTPADQRGYVPLRADLIGHKAKFHQCEDRSGLAATCPRLTSGWSGSSPSKSRREEAPAAAKKRRVRSGKVRRALCGAKCRAVRRRFPYAAYLTTLARNDAHLRLQLGGWRGRVGV